MYIVYTTYNNFEKLKSRDNLFAFVAVVAQQFFDEKCIDCFSLPTVSIFLCCTYTYMYVVMGPSLGSARARPGAGSVFFGGLGLDILRRAQARSRLGLDFLKRAQKIGAFIE